MNQSSNVVNLDSAINMSWVSSQEAASALGVNLNTLYAYVSRGLLRSQPGPQRSRTYSWDDIEKLRQRKRSNPEEVARNSLHWGTPVVESKLTLISSGRLYYRGQDAIALAADISLESLASLLWCDDREKPLPPPVRWAAGPPGDFLSSAIRCLAEGMAGDARAWDLRKPSLLAAGQGIVCALAGLIDPQGAPASLSEIFARHGHRDILRSLLVVTADHELNASTFTARCAASSGANLYCAVIAGLCALAGPRHGATVLAVESLLRDVESLGAAAALEDRLRRGEGIPGFGHRLYPEGDPRAGFLLDLVPPDPRCRELIDRAGQLLGEKPALDLALVSLTRSLQWPREWAFNLFALARSIGWIAHALEEYERGQMIRPRARYVGKVT